MKTKLVLGLVLLAGLPFVFDSCRDTQKPNSGVTFQSDGDEVKESDATLTSFNPQLISNGTGRVIPIVVTLDHPLAAKAVINYSLSGTATLDAANNPGDYDIDGNDAQLTIEKDASSDTIYVRLYEDFDFEYDTAELNSQGVSYETIILKLESVDSGPATIGDQDTFTLKVDEDDAVVILSWDSGDGTAGDVDMDILLSQDGQVVWGAASPGNSFEGMNIPAGFPEGSYGMSYTYYGGSSDNVAFAVYMTNFGGTMNGKTEVNYTGTLSQANINVWDDDTSPDHKGDPVVVQTMNKVQYNYKNISGITKPSSSSRLNAPVLTTAQRKAIFSSLHPLRWQPGGTKK